MRWSLMKPLVLLTMLTQLLPPAVASSSLNSVKTDEQFKAVLETNLLSLFGFSKKPKPNRKNIVIPESMLKLYKKQTGMDLSTTNMVLPGRLARSANTMRSFTHTESFIDDHFRNQHRFRLSFKVDSIPKSETLKAAELHLSRTALHNANHQYHQILVHDIITPGVRGKSAPITRLIDSKQIFVHEDNTTILDVSPAVARWHQNPKQNHGLLVIVVQPKHPKCHRRNFNELVDSKKERIHVRLKRDVDDSSEWRRVEPVLFTFTDDGRYKQNPQTLVSRSKRAIRKHRRKDGREHCRRHELYVDFSEVGWNDWIVAPPGYDAYYCSGDCPFPLSDHLNSTNHAIVQTLVNSVNPSAAPKACCVPTTMAPISMLYLDEESKVVLKNYQDMSILGCGCR